MFVNPNINVTHNIIASHTKNENQESLVSHKKAVTHFQYAKPDIN